MTRARRTRSALLGLAVGSMLALPFNASFADSRDTLTARYIDIRNRHLDELLAKPGVAGVGVGPSQSDPNRLVIRVYTTDNATPEAIRALPTTLDGAPVEATDVPVHKYK